MTAIEKLVGKAVIEFFVIGILTITTVIIYPPGQMPDWIWIPLLVVIGIMWRWVWPELEVICK